MQNIRTDLAVEAHELSRREAKNATEIDGVISDVRTEDGITVTNIEITNENGSKALGKAIGNYITIESPNLKYSIDIYERVCTLISEEIRKMADIKSDSLTLVVGLGNRDITPDALGTEVVSSLLVTHHIKQNMKDFFDDNISGVCALIPGVLGTTGIETAEIIKAVSEKVKPNLIIAVDAMAAADIRRVSTTVQISDTGIGPGAGVENNRECLNEETIGAKVIAIGVPTVIDAATISKVEIAKDCTAYGYDKGYDLVIKRTAETRLNGINYLHCTEI